MKYKCKIVEIKENDEITILIDNLKITGFSNRGISFDVGIEVTVDIELYDELIFAESSAKESYIKRSGNSLSYFIVGFLNVEEMKIDSIIDFSLEPEDLYDYGYLDGKMIEVDILRFNFEFEK